MADITKHEEFDQTYDDPDHPIPSLTHIEVLTQLKGGGAELHIVIAKPLQADDYSLNRLLNKIEGYLGHIRSEDFIAQCGEPDISNTKIIVDIHPDSCNEAFLLLENSQEWVNENRASLHVDRLKRE